MTEKPYHSSDCALHNEPYKPAEPCDCGAATLEDHDLTKAVQTYQTLCAAFGIIVFPAAD